MDQNSTQNPSNGFWQKYGNYVVVGAVIALIVIAYFALNKPDSDTVEGENQQQTTQQGPSVSENQNPNSSSTSSSEVAGQSTGNVQALGTLMVSDNPAKGNLMMQSIRGKIYISTKRDFSSMVGKEVTLNAQGTLDSFVFFGFNQQAPTISVVDSPGAPSSSVFIEGTLQNSDNQDKGNYIILSADGKIYLQTAHDYSAWVGSTVELSAEGTIQSFTKAVVTKK